jgi:hypothetical protein
MYIINAICFLFLIVVQIQCVSKKLKDNIKLVTHEENRLRSMLYGSNLTSLTVVAGEFDDAELKLGCVNDYFSFKIHGKDKSFIISNNNKPIIAINKDSDFLILTNNFEANQGFSFSGDLKIRGVKQWKLFIEEDFSGDSAKGWTKNTLTECGGIRMLGGYCQFGGGEFQKSFLSLPSHSQLRVQATYHFIDAWDNEAGYMRLNNGRNGDLQYAWIERYSAFVGSNGINVCGGRWPEGKLSSPIDVVIPHKSDNITVSFGSTIEQDPCDESFGVSGVRIYVR